MEHKVRVCANSGAWGIRSISLYVDFGNPRSKEERKTRDEIREAIITKSVMAGYPSILHYESIDDIKSATAFLKIDSEALTDDYVEKLNAIASLTKEAEEIKNMDTEWSRKYGAKRVAFLEARCNEYKTFCGYTWRAFELIGIDINDREATRRICTNLGMYRTNI